MSSAKRMRLNFHEYFLKFTFEIQNFQNDSKFRYLSDEFYFAADQDQSKWRIIVHSKSGATGNKFGVFLNLLSDHEINVRYSFKIIDATSQVIAFYESTERFKKSNLGSGKRFNKSLLAKALAPNNVFRVICEIQSIENSDFHPLDLDISRELKTTVSNGDFSDLKIKVGNDNKNIILAHKLILAAASPVLAEEIKKIKRFATPLRLDGFSWETINAMINFISQNGLNLNETNVMEILLAANEYQVVSLQMRCEKFMYDSLTIENALDTLIVVDSSNNPNLFRKTCEFIQGKIRVYMDMKIRWQKFLTEHPNCFKNLFDEIVMDFSVELARSSKSKPNIIKTFAMVADPQNTVSSDYEKLYERMQHSDVVFEVDGQLLKAHKGILSCRSPVFDAMFKYNSLEATENRIKIVDFDYGTVKDFLKFIYCGKVDNLKENAVKLYSIADKYGVMKLKELCKAWMEENVTVNNVLKILKLADLHLFLKDTKTIAFFCILENFPKKIPNWDAFAINNIKILNELLVMILESRK